MKKFSSVSGFNVPQKPDEKEVVANEASLFKVKLLALMNSYLTIETYGPVDRYLREGSIKITGQELFAEAVLNLFDEKSIKEQAKLLESLKSTVRDWESIDNKIESLTPENDFKMKFKVESIINRYQNNDILIGVIENKIKANNNVELLEKYNNEFSKSKLNKKTIASINNIYVNRINQIKNPS